MRLTEKTKPLRSYEGIYIFKPSSAEEIQKAFFQKFKDILEAHKGSIFQVDTWGSRHLANAIDSYQRGVYFHAWFQCEPQGLHELERVFHLNSELLRFYHHKLDSSKTLSEHERFFKEVILKQDQEFLEKKQASKSAASKKPRTAPAS